MRVNGPCDSSAIDEASLLTRENVRRQFADFLDRLASGTLHANEWLSFIVTHHQDEFLEEMRRCTVRLSNGEMSPVLQSTEGRHLLRAWAVALRSAAGGDAEQGAGTDPGGRVV